MRIDILQIIPCIHDKVGAYRLHIQTRFNCDMNMDSDDNAHVHMDNRVLCMLMGNNYLHYSQGDAVGLSFVL